MDDQQLHQQQHHQGAGGDDVRPAHVFNSSSYGGYPSNAPPPSASSSSIMSIHGLGGVAPPAPHPSHHPIAAASVSAPATAGGRKHGRAGGNEEPEGLFPDIPEAKKRKFILVEDSDRRSRLRVRVTLDTVDTCEIPDSFRKSSSVYPRSYFPREMQSPPPSPTGSRFFQDDYEDHHRRRRSGGGGDAEDDGAAETEGRSSSRGGGHARSEMVKALVEDGEADFAIPRMRKSERAKEVRLNDLGFRMAWLQSRVFAGRTVFLQRACEYWALLWLEP